MDAVRIPLSNGGFALVDEADAPVVECFQWRRYKAEGGTYYALCSQLSGVRKHMHRLIMGSEDGRIVDHADRDGLNNTRINLRFATTSQNAANKRKQVGQYTSRFKGVHFRKDTGRWRAFIEARGERIILGNFRNEEDAARAYDAAAIHHFGEFARINFPLALSHA